MDENGKLQEKVKAEFTAMMDEPLTDEERGFLDGWWDARREIERLQAELDAANARAEKAENALRSILSITESGLPFCRENIDDEPAAAGLNLIHDTAAKTLNQK